MEALESFGLLIAALSLMVVLHELGHFLPAKWFGMRVEKFFLFFDWPRKLFSVKKGETEYGIGLLPFGGYVKISGMVDESMDTDHANQPPQPWEFRSKPVWQKFIVMVGGVTMNVILALVIYTLLLGIWGETKTRMDSLKYGFYVPQESPYAKLGMQTGDRITHVNGEPVAFVEDAVNPGAYLQENATLTIARGSETKVLNIPTDLLDTFADLKEDDRLGELMIRPAFEPFVQVIDSAPDPDGQLAPFSSVAKKIGLKDTLKILAVNGKPVSFYEQLSPLLKSNKGKVIELAFEQAGMQHSRFIRLDSSGTLGVLPIAPSYLVFDTVNYSLGAALLAAPGRAFGGLWRNLQGFGKVLRGELSLQKSVGGPVKIAQTYGEATRNAGIVGFLTLTAVLSMWLAFINLLPIPALDGGHIVFLIIEAIMGREPPLKLRMVAQQIGFFLLLALMAFVIVNDFI